MAIGDPYATITELKARLGGIAGAGEDAALTNALAISSRGVELFCGRQFNKVTVASARTYDLGSRVQGPAVISPELAFVDDFHTVTDLVIKTDEDDDGVFETTWTSSDYQVEPLNGVVAGVPGWPFWKIRAVGTLRFPVTTSRAPLQQTAQWGWASVLQAAKEASLLVGEDIYKLKDAPWGVAGSGEWGLLRVRQNPMASAMLADYRRDAIKVGGG